MLNKCVRVSAVSLVAATGILTAGSPAATAAPAAPRECTPALGVAGLYNEFVEKDATRYSDAEGAVAVGGNATFGDEKTRQGFSVGSNLTPDLLQHLPDGHSMVVGGTLKANQVTLVKGSAVYGKLDPAYGKPPFNSGDHKAGKSPIDFGKEFATLRGLSKTWSGFKPNGKVTVAKGSSPASTTISFTGHDTETNVFTVEAAKLAGAGTIKVDVPAGSTTLINVLGDKYDMQSAPTHDLTAPDAHKLLWNFPQATYIRKNYTAWQGTILAPNASVHLGGPTQGVGPGVVNGEVIAKELLSIPGAETHQVPFTGCVSPSPTPPTPTPTPPTPTPTPTPTPPKPKPKPSPTSPAPGPTHSSAPPAPAPTHASTPPKPPVPPQPSSSSSSHAAPTGKDTPSGHLAHTGSDGTLVMAISAAASLAAGIGLFFLTRKWRSRRS
ncbi:choice-of-anchor A family protein [Streptomyces sp. NPDC002537]